ncbi:hypothetical protein KCV87_27755 [Actinosynnema pretiosum subsp. pretiosum]|uniref:Uncharacterized protein n=2 Tax=Actinosynnema TaxID=40566 RepID=C6WB68_ACTMD|nr:hypothetical protein [Actinosynnema mirum]ACU39359.1 hypothetical protein Amir_5541 [Actinosynnema mirum DSM 43827]AXX32957.1 hypothetical protein APASM_5592 [Actinosynnema pretiosum subsp. pretiosum]QUF03183.1 hypothetical protein KCV87_27755 [Actinosynnema pretiosum subsp. pretiosum]
MSKTSLTDRLVALRRAETGENTSQAVPAVRAVLSDLPDERRDHLVDALNGAGDARGLLIPEPASREQRELECAVLQAATDAGSHLQLRPPASMVRPAHAFRAAEPGPHGLRLHLAEHALGPLLYELLPRLEDDGGVSGVPGLRVRRHPRSIELLVPGSPAGVVLAGVDEALWREGMAYVRTLLRDRDLSHRFAEGDLHGSERAHLAEFPRRSGLAASALRRPALLAAAPWTRTLARDDQWWLEWPEGPALPAVAQRLVHPVVGIPGLVATTTSPESATLSDGWWSLHVRVVQGPDPANEEALAAMEWPPGVTGWSTR